MLGQNAKPVIYILKKRSGGKNPVLTDDRRRGLIKNYTLSHRSKIINNEGYEEEIVYAENFGVFGEDASNIPQRNFLAGKRDITFSDGILVVPAHKKKTIDYCDNHSGNTDNPKRPPNAKKLFYRFKQDEIIDDNIKREVEAAKIITQVTTADFEKELIPVMMRAGYPVNDKDSNMIVHDAIKFAKNNRDVFEKMMNESAYNERASELNKALKLGVVRYSSYQFIRSSDNEVIISVPANASSPVEFFLDYSFSEKGKTDWNFITIALDKMDDKREKRSEAVEQEAKNELDNIMDDYKGLKTEELVETAKEVKVLKWNAGKKCFEIILGGGEKHALEDISKDELVSHLEKNGKGRNLLVKAVSLKSLE